jgi:membrane protease subunit HflK
MSLDPKSPWASAGNSSADKSQKKPESKAENSSQGAAQNSQESQEKKKPVADFDQFFKKLFSKMENKPKESFFDLKSEKSTIGLVVLGTILLWLSFGFYKVAADENAVVLYFGKFYKVTTSGLNYALPYPFGKVIKQSVARVNIEEFGFSSSGDESDKVEAEGLMLTGDENIVDIEFQVQWQVSDIKNFTFNIAAQNQSIRDAAESAMREIIARAPIVNALSDGKQKIESDAKDLLQQILDSYKSGVRVVLVQLRRVDPPKQVIDSFRDVQTAKADKEKEINQAQAYANDIIPRARGEASRMIEQASAYSKEVVSNAEGEAGRFLSVYNQYAQSKNVTKKRMYLETMEKIYHDTNKVIIDSGATKSGVVPYFPINNEETKVKKSDE